METCPIKKNIMKIPRFGREGKPQRLLCFSFCPFSAIEPIIRRAVGSPYRMDLYRLDLCYEKV